MSLLELRELVVNPGRAILLFTEMVALLLSMLFTEMSRCNEPGQTDRSSNSQAAISLLECLYRCCSLDDNYLSEQHRELLELVSAR